MSLNITQLVSHDGREIALYTWDNVKNPKAVVKIAHGMAEHAGRYDHFAKFLNDNGYIVVANDHRGHGKTAAVGDFGYEEGDMFQNNVEDQVFVLNMLKDKYKLPVVLFGHSYGSFVTQAVIEHNSVADAFIVCGSSCQKGFVNTAGGVVSNITCKNKGGRAEALKMHQLSLGGFAKKFEGENAWLSRDQEQVDKYNSDEMCGFICSANFYRSFMNGLKKLYKKSSYVSIDVNKPILLIAGQMDPVGGEKGNKKLLKFYQRVGVADIQLKLYDDARHEILNETNKDEVYADVLNWLNEKISK